MKKVFIGIIGCGVISNTYIKDIKRLYPELVIRALADIEPEKAREYAAIYGVLEAMTVEEILRDSAIEIIVNLTPPVFHADLNRRILEAGKHVFCEKPLALSLRDAIMLCDFAEDQKLRIGCAPDTFLGSSLMTCKKLLEDGWIGKPLSVCANMMNHGVETWHTNPYPFYEEGGGPLFDMGPYYFSLLLHLFGRVKEVQAIGGCGFEERMIESMPHKGEKIQVKTPTHYAVLLKMEKGILVNMNFSFDIWKSTMPMMEIYGTEGTLSVPDPNLSGGTPKVYRREQKLAEIRGGSCEQPDAFYEIPELYQNVGSYTRGKGIWDLAQAIQLDTRHQTNGRFATHVVEIITGIMESVKTQAVYQMKTQY